MDRIGVVTQQEEAQSHATQRTAHTSQLPQPRHPPHRVP